MKTLNVALAGNLNCGKTTVFTALTALVKEWVLAGSNG